MREELATRDTVTEAIYGSGFNSSGRFYSESSQMLGMTPGTFRRGGTGEVIRFAVGECSLGSILVAASVKGVCAISLGDNPDRLVQDLQTHFSKAQLIGGDKAFAQMVAQVVRFVEIAENRFEFAARCARHGVSAESVASVARHSRRLDGQLCRRRPASGLAQGRAGGGGGVRSEPHCGRDSLSPGAAQRRRPLRLSLGHRAQMRPAGKGTAPRGERCQTRRGTFRASLETLIDLELAQNIDQHPQKFGQFSPLEFSDANTILHFGWGGYLFDSPDRGVTWKGPFQLPLFDMVSWQLRTDYLVEDRNTVAISYPSSYRSKRRAARWGEGVWTARPRLVTGRPHRATQRSPCACLRTRIWDAAAGL